jgi:hypothetical protein
MEAVNVRGPEPLPLALEGVVFFGVGFFLGAKFAGVELDWVVEFGVTEPEDIFPIFAVISSMQRILMWQ